MWFRFLVPLLAQGLALNPVTAAPGPLLIAGGAIASDNAAIARAVLEHRPPRRPGIAIIPAASSEPMASFEAARRLFLAHGARAQYIRLVPLASEDDPATAEDERRWAAGGTRAAARAAVRDAGAIWFTGGDQSRLMALLTGPDGTPTPLLRDIRAAHRAGALVGGTSAGAAVLSNPMLTGGDPLTAVAGPGEGREAITIASGLGLFTAGLIDQHFSERGRLPRLLFVLQRLPPPQRLGFGIDENTALLVAGGRVQALGTGLVTILDARAARPLDGEGLGATDLGLRWLANGQSIPLP